MSQNHQDYLYLAFASLHCLIPDNRNPMLSVYRTEMAPDLSGLFFHHKPFHDLQEKGGVRVGFLPCIPLRFTQQKTCKKERRKKESRGGTGGTERKAIGEREGGYRKALSMTQPNIAFFPPQGSSNTPHSSYGSHSRSKGQVDRPPHTHTLLVTQQSRLTTHTSGMMFTGLTPGSVTSSMTLQTGQR